MYESVCKDAAKMSSSCLSTYYVNLHRHLTAGRSGSSPLESTEVLLRLFTKEDKLDCNINCSVSLVINVSDAILDACEVCKVIMRSIIIMDGVSWSDPSPTKPSGSSFVELIYRANLKPIGSPVAWQSVYRPSSGVSALDIYASKQDLR